MNHPENQNSASTTSQKFSCLKTGKATRPLLIICRKSRQSGLKTGIMHSQGLTGNRLNRAATRSLVLKICAGLCNLRIKCCLNTLGRGWLFLGTALRNLWDGCDIIQQISRLLTILVFEVLLHGFRHDSLMLAIR